jgi:hypothetical protein
MENIQTEKLNMGMILVGKHAGITMKYPPAREKFRLIWKL